MKTCLKGNPNPTVGLGHDETSWKVNGTNGVKKAAERALCFYTVHTTIHKRASDELCVGEPACGLA